MGIFADLEDASLLQRLRTTHLQLITHVRLALTHGTHSRRARTHARHALTQGTHPRRARTHAGHALTQGTHPRRARTHARHAPTQGTHTRRARTHAGHARTGTFPPPFCLFPRPRLQAALGYVMHADLTGHPSCTGRPALLLGKGAPSLVLTAQEREANSQQPLFAGMVGKLPAPTWSLQSPQVCRVFLSFPLLSREYLTSSLRVLLNPLSLSLRRRTPLLPSSLMGGGTLSSSNH